MASLINTEITLSCNVRINIYIIGTLSFFNKSYMKFPFILTFCLISTTPLFDELIVFVVFENIS